MKILASLACVMLCANAYAECTTNARGAVVCNNGESAAGYNRNTGNGFTSEKNQNGVTTTQTTKGGEAKTKDGKGVYTSPSGKTCARTARHQGCN
ncbi:hypothetical protein [Cupriavidus basilensis]|uniref:Uncharacterized protein n=1 Tax=Cupriavidus basilensis TaxID=68895 RepID=A0A643G1W8_9BURK|nr:hypothetical protein [Cupriavidus basilensis]QOT77509.1 hypothetical protein F7R26_005520 [Cupriavidus basilensis]